MSGSLLVKDTFSRVRVQVCKLLGAENVALDTAALALHSYDSGLARFKPEAVLSVPSAGQLAPLVRLLWEQKVPMTQRGAGTSLAGGCAPAKGGAVLSLGRLNKILEIDTVSGYALAEVGVTNWGLQSALADCGFFFSPLPLSSRSCTLGGNIAVNSSGPRSLKYGCTADNLIALDVVAPDGEQLSLSRLSGGPDLPGFFSGTEGTFGTAVRAKVRIFRRQPHLHSFVASFDSHEELLKAVSQAQLDGVVFRSLEALDRMTATAVESCFRTGYPLNCEALALGELDGSGETVAAQMKALRHAFKTNGCSEFKSCESDPSSEPVWLSRRQAFAAVSRLAPSIAMEDFSVPRKKIGLAIAAVTSALAQHDLRAGLVYSPCTGVLRPHMLFDERNVFETRRVRKSAHEMLKAVSEMSGAVSGGLGTGVEKRTALSWQHSDCELGILHALKDAADPLDLCNPEKIIPVAKTRSLKKIAHVLTPAAQALVAELKKRVPTSTHSFIFGSGTRLGDFSGEQLSGEKLSTGGICSLLELDADNGYFSAEAGISLAELAAKLRENGFSVPFKSRTGTLGGLLASGQWLAPETSLVDMIVALADGSVVQFGSRSLAPGVGFHAAKAFLGSWGCFGVLLSASFRLCGSADIAVAELELAEFGGLQSGPALAIKKVFDPLGLLNPGLCPRGER